MKRKPYEFGDAYKAQAAKAKKAGFLSAADACEVIGIDRARLASWAKARGVASRKVGREIWYNFVVRIYDDLIGRERECRCRRMLGIGLVIGDAKMIERNRRTLQLILEKQEKARRKSQEKKDHKLFCTTAR